MKKSRKILPYLLTLTVIFYILLAFMKNTGSAMLILLVLMPLACFLISLFYGQINSFTFIFPFLVMLLFIPSIFIFYNESAFVYVFVFGAISVAGSLMGARITRKI